MMYVRAVTPNFFKGPARLASWRHLFCYGQAKSAIDGARGLVWAAPKANVFSTCLRVVDGVDENIRLQNMLVFCKRLLFLSTPSATHKHIEKTLPKVSGIHALWHHLLHSFLACLLQAWADRPGLVWASQECNRWRHTWADWPCLLWARWRQGVCPGSD